MSQEASSENRQKLIQEFQELLSFFYRFKRSDHHPALHHCTFTRSQLEALCMLHHKGTMGVKELADQQGVSSSATTQLVDHLVEHGFLDRSPDVKDRRSVRLRLSRKGKTIIDSWRKEQEERMLALLSPLSDKELAKFLQLASKITKYFTSLNTKDSPHD
jgi:DNA-binding MarR family transcriptional regulator